MSGILDQIKYLLAQMGGAVHYTLLILPHKPVQVVPCQLELTKLKREDEIYCIRRSTNNRDSETTFVSTARAPSCQF